MNLSQLSDADLIALRAGDLTKVSDQGLLHLKGQAAQVQTFSPTEGMSFGEKFLAGTGKAFADTGRGIAGLVGLSNAADVAESRRLDAPLMKTGAGMAGNITGNTIMALMPGAALKGAGAVAGAVGAGGAANALGTLGSSALAPVTLRGAAALGGAMGAVQPAVDWQERGKNALIGGAAGAGGQAAFNALGRIVLPQTAPGVKQLMAEGITPTPGQILGGGFKRAEEGLTSVPIVGDAIKKGQRRAAEDFNRAAFNRALAPIAEKLPKNVGVGRDAINFVEDALGSKYESLMPRLTTSADGQFITEIQQLRNGVGNGAISPPVAQQFEKILNNDLLSKFQGPNATLTGQTLKQVESDLGQMAKTFRSSPDPDHRLLGDAVMEAQDILRQTVMRSNPQAATELKAINEGWANFKRVQKAAAGVGSESGIFTPAQLQGAVKAMDRSKDKGAFARGSALMQDLSEPAKNVLANKLPDSGTPFRTMMALGASGGAAMINPLAAAGVAAAPIAYSQPGQAAIAAMLTRRPNAALPLSNALRRLAPYAVAPSIGYANE
jgi:hypothetical protein